MKFIFLAIVILLGSALSVALFGCQKKSINKKESLFVRHNAKDFPEHGISLIVPSDPSFGHLLSNREAPSIQDPYSVLLKNTSTRSVAGYSLKWQCFDGSGETASRNLSNDRHLNRIVSWVFLQGEESARQKAIDAADNIIKPSSIWFISSEGLARRLDWSGDAETRRTTQQADTSEGATIEGCASMTVIVDGVFFDNGAFIGPDTIGLFTRVKSELDARHELLRAIQNDLESGKKAEEVFKELERMRDAKPVRLGELPTADQFRDFFRILFCQRCFSHKRILRRR